MPKDVWSLIGVLLSILLILLLAYLFTKYVVGRSTLGISAVKKPSGELCVLSQLSVGRGEQLVLVKLHARCLLLAVTSTEISVLTELSQEEAEPWLCSSDSAAQSLHFLDILRDSIAKKK
ncbi:MAG: flagellar biosynthetic protein FliO [Lawsonibacter sp.]|nr:flagellar biosynthetic protein FliO [Lawsonibacter sp.]